ncbi:PadR family transcriptional regulator [Jeotgalibacillus proteolyticus]|uniref:PadR family transcriptional regulator n=1 Tax=Jeotgalibacillus proteolyticus TaxID=2082395 RepID=A0A2S5G6E1_9BACL|nr:PadR family transcriptional regulator [Jeotgalibacillus proteolyticus]PPA68491.1 PadR family transcriptional regulator [Jeotgalibacillus proteolyticus]
MNKSQMLKGVLEGCILAVIEEKPTYGYELYVKLSDQGLESVSEGSIYPVLLRIQKEGLIEGTLVKSTNGPNRKYYSLTDKGKEALARFKEEWEKLAGSVSHILLKGRSKMNGHNHHIHSAEQ